MAVFPRTFSAAEAQFLFSHLSHYRLGMLLQGLVDQSMLQFNFMSKGTTSTISFSNFVLIVQSKRIWSQSTIQPENYSTFGIWRCNRIYTLFFCPTIAAMPSKSSSTIDSTSRRPWKIPYLSPIWRKSASIRQSKLLLSWPRCSQKLNSLEYTVNLQMPALQMEIRRDEVTVWQQRPTASFPIVHVTFRVHRLWINSKRLTRSKRNLATTHLSFVPFA